LPNATVCDIFRLREQLAPSSADFCIKDDAHVSQSTSSSPEVDHPSKHQRSSLATLSLTALGVVFGDIGTSPLYALKECFHSSHGLVPTPDNIFGILSLIFWALVLVISVKYLSFILRADNQGEGGIMALTALILPHKAREQGNRKLLVILWLFGAALLIWRWHDYTGNFRIIRS
jgi:KUP system potassium uptake protein